ncbi:MULTISPECIES: Rrf2 family transcriptional regulator [Streptomyces]|uniref:Rrf2 family transcriptional regulator n=1 Tax=Streptomyces TaxID=1883 RepID=UPI001F1FEC15|nr:MULTISPECIES: Rrf2 family transcriptional regulator [Streptomyces]
MIIRRRLGDLRRAGLVEVRHGAGAGWSPAREPEKITLLEVYDAVDAQPTFGLHHTDPHPECPVGRGIRPALSGVYDRVERVMRQEPANTSIADVLRETLVNQPAGRWRAATAPLVVTKKSQQLNEE